MEYFYEHCVRKDYKDAYEIENIILYNHNKTEFIYSEEQIFSEINDKEPNGYLVYWVDHGSMSFSGKHFILISDIRDYKLNKII